MAYDEELAARIRDLLGDEREVTEKKMFGGLAFLVRGNMAIGASGQGGALVRCNPDDTDTFIANSNAETMVMRGRAMAGWLRVSKEHLHTKRELKKWVDIGTTQARTL